MDTVLGFSVGGGAVRGRVARLGASLDASLSGGHYPEPVARLLAETAVLAAVLAAALKYDGIFSLQAQGKGPVGLLVAEVASADHFRIHARFDPERLAALSEADRDSASALLGEGYLAFTVDQGPDTERYQGIVELAGVSLEDSARAYFKQSEQLDTAVLSAVRPPSERDGHWLAAAAMIQRMPAGSRNSPILVAGEAEDGWRRAEMLLGSLTPAEMLDRSLGLETLLHRLYHAEQLQTFAPKTLEHRCRCSRERVLAALAGLPADDIDHLAEGTGTITVTCEFCHADHIVPVSERGRAG